MTSGRARNGRLVQRVGWAVIAIMVVGAFSFGVLADDGEPQTDAERAYSIKETTLCPVCDGQNVLESNAPIATSIRVLIDERVAEGISSEAIRTELAAIHGRDVNATPPSSGWGSLVWILPVVGLVIGGAGIGLSVSRWRSQGAARAGDADVELVESARSERQ